MGGSLGDLVKNVITLGSYGQSKAQEEAAAAQRKAEMEARRIAAEKKPMEETATMQLNPDANVNTLGILGLTVDKKKESTASTGVGLNTTGSVGLGFGV